MLAAALVLIFSPWRDAFTEPVRNYAMAGERVACQNGPCCVDWASFPYALGPITWTLRWRSLAEGEEFTAPENHAIRLCKGSELNGEALRAHVAEGIRPSDP
jgi:hypothetical protein